MNIAKLYTKRIKKAYKKTTLLSRQTRGGNAGLFNLITKSYVFEEYNKTQNNQQFNELKQQSNDYFDKQNNQGVTKLKSKIYGEKKKFNRFI